MTKDNYIIIDTNIFINDYSLKGKELARLLTYHKIWDINIVIPQIVIDELLGNYRKTLYEKRQLLLKSVNSANKLFVKFKKNQFNTENYKKIFENQLNIYKATLENFIQSNNLTILDYPSVSHRTVVKDMYDNVLPFNIDKTEIGYKDYLILWSIKKFSKKIKKNSNLLLFTKNTKDFVQTGSSLRNFKGTKINIIKELDDIKSFKKKSSVLEKIGMNEEEYFKLIVKALFDDPFVNINLYNDIIFEPTITWKHYTVIDFKIENWEDFITVNGTIELKMTLDFQTNSIELSEENVFYNKIITLLKPKKIDDQDFWELKFYDFNLTKKIDFNHNIYDGDFSSTNDVIFDIDFN